MSLSTHTRALLQGIVAGAVALAGATACSRDRADTNRDTTQVGEASPAVTPNDTHASATTPPATTDTTAPAARDTAVARVETATPAPSKPSPDEPQDTAAAPTAGQDVSGYQAMGHAADDTSAAGAKDTSVAVVGDTSDTASAEMANAAVDTVAKADTMAAGYEPMARDTSTALAQGEAEANSDTVATPTEPVRPPADSTEVLGAVTDTAGQAETDTTTITARVDTTTEAPTEVAVEDTPDTVTVVGDSSSVDHPGPRAKEDTVAQKADSLAKYHGAEHARAPEDSTEANTEANYDVEAVGDANDDAVGAAQVESTGNIATGADAVALITRLGQACRVENSSRANWDLASSPATLNPCGTGTMTLPKVQTGDEE